jgi:serine/threonine protein kinase
MPTPWTVEQRFEQRVTARALADTLAALPPRCTISPQVLFEAGIASSLVEAPDRMPSSTNVSHTATANLPRLALTRRPASGTVPQSSTPAADLEVLGILGEGGMGCVLLARQHSLARDVAIKTLKDADDTELSIAGLLQEARITGTLEHPGIVPVHALGLDERGSPLLVMKRIEGISFRVLLEDPAHPAWERISAAATDHVETSLEILMRVCQSLAFAHHRGILHRDIKPENIMVGDYGEIYLCDWGIATRIDDASASSMLAGTLLYMAPEMLLGETLDARSDVYLLGASRCSQRGARANGGQFVRFGIAPAARRNGCRTTR